MTQPRLRELGDRSNVRAVILDTPANSPDDYIIKDLSDNWISRNIYHTTVPYAVRMSSGTSKRNLISLCSQLTVPVLLTRCNPGEELPTTASDALIRERLRVYPEATHFFETQIPGYVDGWITNQAHYEAELKDFFAKWIP